MNNVENEYQKRFSDKQDTTPYFDAEDLWSAISSEVQPKRRNKRKLVLFFFLGISIFGLGTFLWDSINNSYEHTQNTHLHSEDEIINTEFVESKVSIDKETESAQENTESLELGSIKKDNFLLESKSDKTKESVTNQTQQAFLGQLPEKSNDKISTKLNRLMDTNIPSQINLSDNSQIITALQSKVNTNLPNTANKHQGSPLTTNRSQLLERQTFIPKIQKINIEPIFTFAYDHLSSIDSAIVDFPILIPSNLDLNLKKSKDNKPNPGNLTIDLYGGINWNSNNYSSNNIELDMLKNESESAYTGNTFGVSLSKSAYKNLSFSAGVEYTTLWTKTEVNLSIDSTQLLENQLVKITVNNQNLDTIFDFRDTLVSAQYTLELVHHNNVKTISFPISIGYHYETERFDLGVNLGIVYSLRIDQSGKGYNNQGEIYEYSRNTSDLPFKKSSIAFRMSPLVRYKLNESYSVTLSPQYQFSSGNHINDSSVKVNSSIWHVNVGVGKRF